MPMLIYKPMQSAPAQFLQFWSDVYGYAKENLYEENIDKKLTEQSIFPFLSGRTERRYQIERKSLFAVTLLTVGAN